MAGECKHLRHQFVRSKVMQEPQFIAKEIDLALVNLILFNAVNSNFNEFKSFVTAQAVALFTSQMACTKAIHVIRCPSSSPTERKTEMCMFAFRDCFSPSIFCSPAFNVCVPQFIALSIQKHP